MSDNKIKKIGVLTSGGDAPGMNAAIRAVVRACIYYDIIPYGIREGYEGLIQNDMYRMEAGSVKHIVHQGGTILKSARCQFFYEEEGRERGYRNLKDRGIDALVVIGGDGTFKGAKKLGEEYNYPVIGIPGTIDNDIYGTDFTIGFDTATNTVVEAVDQIRDTATSHNRLFFIEVMGRDSGYIAIHSGIAAGAEEILIPEKDRGMDKLIESLELSSRRNKTSRLVIVAEGEKTGNIYDLAENVKQKFGDRYETKVTILGHIQRGGRPSCADRVLASRLGVAAVEALIEGKCSIMVGVKDHKVKYTRLDKATKESHTIEEELLKIADIVSI